MKKLHILLTAILITVGYTASSHADQTNILAIEQALTSSDLETLSKLSHELTGYEAAFANYRLAMCANNKQQSDLAKSSINTSIEQLEALDKSQTSNAEVKALLAMAYGYKISLQPHKAMYLGPKSLEKIESAEALENTNPRVLLAKGLNKAHTPAIFGGDRDEAIQILSQSIEAFSKDDSDYQWGHAEAYTWRGIMHQQKEQAELAKADWEMALNVAPNYGWAKVLLDQLNN